MTPLEKLAICPVSKVRIKKHQLNVPLCQGSHRLAFGKLIRTVNTVQPVSEPDNIFHRCQLFPLHRTQ